VYGCRGRESEFIRKIIANDYLSDPLLKSYSDDIIKLVNELMSIKNLKVDDVIIYKDKSNLFYEFPFLLKGVILDFGVRNPNVLDERNSIPMNVAMFLTDLPEIPLDYQFKFIVDDIEAFNNFRKSLSEFLEGQAKKLSSMEVRMLLCFGKVSTSLVENLSRHKILVVDTLGEFYIEKLRKVCGCSPVYSIKSLTKTQLGKVKRVVVRKDEGGKHVLIEGFDDIVECFTILLRGAESKIDEIERLVDSIIRLIVSFKKEPKVVYGGGCTEIKLARLLRKMSTMYSNKVQKAIEAYAVALEELVGILIENSGRDPLTELARLNRYNSREDAYYGIDMESRDLVDVKNKELYEALSVKKAYIKNATKAALLSLKPDRIISEEVKF
jgi:chaperonin GroEL (HSP60 family)